MFRRSSRPQPCEALAAAEQTRADGLAHRIHTISTTPGHPSAGSLPLYRAAYRDACTTAARHTTQPAAPLRKWGSR